MESFCHTLKVEFVQQRHGVPRRSEADLFGYIEEYYNQHRIHSALCYLSIELAELKPIHQSRRQSNLFGKCAIRLDPNVARADPNQVEAHRFL